MRLGGDEFRSGLLMILSLITAHSLHALLLPYVSRLFFGSRLPGLYAASLFVILPAFAIVLARETIYVAVGLMIFCLLSDRIARNGWNGAAKGVAIGATCGVLVLLNPISLLFCLAWMAYLLYSGSLPRPKMAQILIAFAAGLILLCMPWTIRNHRQLGGWFFIRSNFGLELSVANNPCAEASLLENMVSGCHAQTHPNSNAAEALAVKQMGELPYSRAKQAIALQWIFAHPGRFFSLSLQRAMLFWFPYRGMFQPSSGYAVCFITAVSLFGLYDLLRARARVGAFLFGASLLYSGLYYTMQADLCYRYPILWISLLCAGYAAARRLHPLGAAILQGKGREAPPVGASVR
jgi:hypothetical protein